MSAAIQIENLAYRYRGNWLIDSKLVLEPFSLEVNQGEAFGFLGHNGAGKTTAIKCMLGLIRPKSGTIKIFGVDSRDPRARQSIGYLPEQPYFYDNLSVQEIVTHYARLAGVARSQIKSAVETALAKVDLINKRKAAMRSLSKGLTQRVALAQAIVNQPKLLILDEPFSGLDPIGRMQFRDLFYALKTSGTTIFMCSHILSDVEFLCDRVSILARGKLRGVFNLSDVPSLVGGQYELTLRTCEAANKILQEGSNEIVANQRFVRAIFADRAKAHHALSKAINQNLEVESFQFMQGSLEKLFVKLVNSSESDLTAKAP